MMSRRGFLARTASAGGSVFLHSAGAGAAETHTVRRYHLCLSSKIVEQDPGLLDNARDAGVSDIWQAAFFYGHWYETPERLRAARRAVEARGLRWHLINVPLGHPGDSLGDSTGATPLTSAHALAHGRAARRARYSGTSLHPPGTEENVEAVRALSALEPDHIFLDDDFRLATGPGGIGGCFCEWHKRRFLEKGGYVLDDTPIVCAFYPTAKSVLLWSLSEEKKTLRLQWSGKTIPLEVAGLDVTLVFL